MLIGVSGCGKQSLTRLASFMLEYHSFSIKLSKNYKPQNFRDNLKEKMLESGCDAKANTFLLTDTQIMHETFLEDINNILNTGEITNLYVPDDTKRMKESLSKVLQQMKRPETNDVVYQTYIERLRDNFHIILCMSPVGDQLRIRCRKFPSLVNCCTLDWFDNWPEDALTTVSRKFLNNMDNVEDNVKNKLSEMFMHVHKSVETISIKFYDELRRKVYITPKSYLDGINLYLA
jgi:dynein heavy chain